MKKFVEMSWNALNQKHKEEIINMPIPTEEQYNTIVDFYKNGFFNDKELDRYTFLIYLKLLIKCIKFCPEYQI